MTDRIVKPWVIAAFCAAVVVCVLVAVLAPRFLAWMLGNPAEAGTGGAVGGGLLYTAAKLWNLRRQSKDAVSDHRAASALNAERIEAANVRASERVEEASQDPGPATEAPETVEDEEARRERLRSASDRLR